MITPALDDPAVARLREAVPEFEAAFQRLIEERGPDASPFQAGSRFGDWLVERLTAAERTPPALLHRSFKLLDELWRDRQTQFGTEIASEAYGVLADEPRAMIYLPEHVREWARPARERRSGFWSRLWRRD